MFSLLRMKFIMPFCSQKMCVANTTQSYAHDSPVLRELYKAARPAPLPRPTSSLCPAVFFNIREFPGICIGPSTGYSAGCFPEFLQPNAGKYLKLAMNLPSLIFISLPSNYPKIQRQ